MVRGPFTTPSIRNSFLGNAVGVDGCTFISKVPKEEITSGLQELGPDMGPQGSHSADCWRKKILAVQVTKGGSLTGLSHAGRIPPPIYV